MLVGAYCGFLGAYTGTRGSAISPDRRRNDRLADRWFFASGSARPDCRGDRHHARRRRIDQRPLSEPLQHKPTPTRQRPVKRNPGARPDPRARQADQRPIPAFQPASDRLPRSGVCPHPHLDLRSHEHRPKPARRRREARRPGRSWYQRRHNPQLCRARHRALAASVAPTSPSPARAASNPS